MSKGSITAVIAFAVLISLLDGATGYENISLREMVKRAKMVYTEYLPFKRASLSVYEQNPKKLLTSKTGIPCPLPANVTVICNVFSGYPCFCVNTISHYDIHMNANYHCSENPWRFIHYIRVDLNVTATREINKCTSKTELMSPEEMEEKLLREFNRNRINPRDRIKTHWETDDIRFFRLTCDFSYYLTVYMGISTGNRNTTGQNVTLNDLGFNEQGILNSTVLQIDRIRSIEREQLPYSEIKPVLVMPKIPAKKGPYVYCFWNVCVRKLYVHTLIVGVSIVAFDYFLYKVMTSNMSFLC